MKRLALLLLALLPALAHATLRTKTVEYAFETRTTDLATATRNDFSAITVYIPETTSRTFRSVVVEVYAMHNSTTAVNTTATLVGMKLGAAAFSDSTVTATFTASGDPYSFFTTRDFTSYWNTNFGAGSSQTAQVGVQFTGPTTNTISAKLIITYEYDDSATTRVRTVHIPLESNTASLTSTLASIGSTQIPALDTLLPEASKTYREIWFEMRASNGGNATTDFQLGVRLDAESEVLRGLNEQQLNGAVYYEDFWIRNDMDTSTTHDFQARSTVTSRFSGFSVLLCVTYEYDHSSSTRVMNSLMLPFADESGFLGNTTSADKSRFQRTIFIEEPGTITLAQSGILVTINDPGTVTLNLAVGSQSFRAYALTAGSVQSGPYTVQHRIDSGSAVGAFGSLARGRNTINFDRYTTALGSGSNFSAILYLNYTSDIASAGDGVHNHTTAWGISQTTNVINTQKNISAPDRLFNLPEASYFSTGLMYLIKGFNVGSAASAFVLQAEKTTASPAAGWEDFIVASYRSDAEASAFWTAGAAREQFERWPNDPDTTRMALETSRQYRMGAASNLNSAITSYLTYHSFTSTVSGTISGSAGGTVNLYLYRTLDNSLVLSTSRTGNGAYSFDWYDDVGTVYVRAYEDATHKGSSKEAAAGTGFDISLSGGGTAVETYF